MNAAESSGPRYWRSLSELARGRNSADGAAAEFAEPFEPPAREFTRRDFLKIAGSAMALSGLSACTREPVHPIVPYVKRPEELIPGRPLHYATAMPFNGFATGLLVESHEGHPTKIEGNPNHPSSLGATGIFQQAALLDLYDPDRPRTVTEAGRTSNYPSFLAELENAMREQRARRGAGLRILTQGACSPTMAAQLDELRRQFPEARWHQFEPLARDNTLEGARLAFGKAVEARYHLDRARVVLSLDSDFLFAHPDCLALTRRFADGRRIAAQGGDANRLYVMEPTPSLTGSVADHRIPATSGEIEILARALAVELGVTAANPSRPLAAKVEKWLHALTEDLKQAQGACAVIAGEPQPPTIHALAHLINTKLGAVGKTVEYTRSAQAKWVNHRQSIQELRGDLEKGIVECLIIIGGNPVFDAPAELQWARWLERVKMSIHLHTDFNETSAQCQWHVPESHFLEAWGDARAFDGTASVIQPLIAPLYESKTAHEVLHAAIHSEVWSDYDIVRAHWRSQIQEPDFENAWRRILHDGVVEGSAFAPVSIQPNSSAAMDSAAIGSSEKVELLFRPDPTIWDGRFANNGWLQEAPKPFSKVTWDNPALISPALAQRLQLESGDIVELRLKDASLAAPVWITPGQAENSVTVHLGNGRTRVGSVGKNVGVNGYPLRSLANYWAGPGLEIVKTGRRATLASTQHMHNVEGRDIIRTSTLLQFRADHDATKKGREPEPAAADTLYNANEFKIRQDAWGMAIDLNACIGCNACALACQAENNIPVVGKEQVAAGRDMAWIRIDQYFEGPAENPRVHHQPVPCMHCENAPCELVCPVGATLHDHEGLNLQVYNRCVGTRYCSNNCPYKVRRFNFFRYSDFETPSLKSMRNPNVTVRWRGVMEKCTYCIQRISAARIAAEIENRPIRDGEIKTACQQVCPARAITFGNIDDSATEVSKWKGSPLNYAMLGELNTRPRTTYLARLRNPHPKLEGEA